MSATDGRADRADAGELALVVNSFNRKVLLVRALESVYRYMDPLPDEVVVVDDGSTDGSAELVREWMASGRYPGLRLLQPATKVGFAGGVNLGITSTTARYVCLFETDNVVSDAGMWKGVAHLKANPRVAAVGFRVTTIEGATAGNSTLFPTPLSFVLGQQLTARLGLDRPAPGPRREVVYTSPLVLARTAIEKVGLMDAEHFPFSDCDIEWCRRMNDAGFELHVLEDVSVVHDQGEHKSEFSRRRTLDYHRARLQYFQIYSPRLVPAIRTGLLARHLVELALLEAGALAGKVPPERVAVRRELLRLWPRSYRPS
jgi:GT2 family glycosyltransferase